MTIASLQKCRPFRIDDYWDDRALWRTRFNLVIGNGHCVTKALLYSDSASRVLEYSYWTDDTARIQIPTCPPDRHTILYYVDTQQNTELAYNVGLNTEITVEMLLTIYILITKYNKVLDSKEFTISSLNTNISHKTYLPSHLFILLLISIPRWLNFNEFSAFTRRWNMRIDF